MQVNDLHKVDLPKLWNGEVIGGECVRVGKTFVRRRRLCRNLSCQDSHASRHTAELRINNIRHFTQLSPDRTPNQ